jgi:hypothetical protein
MTKNGSALRVGEECVENSDDAVAFDASRATFAHATNHFVALTMKRTSFTEASAPAFDPAFAPVFTNDQTHRLCPTPTRLARNTENQAESAGSRWLRRG